MYTERNNARVSRCARQPMVSFRREQLIVFAFAVFGVSLAAADPATTKTMFNIEELPAQQSLTLYARQAHVQLGFAADIVEDILTNPVKGEYENAQALELLLEGTGLEAEHGESGIIVRRIPERVVTSGIEEPATVVAETNSLQLMQTATQAASQTATSSAGNTSDEEYEEAVKKPEEVVVTGSRIRGAQSASTMVTFTRQEMDQAGFATVEELVERLPQNFGAGASLDTFTDSPVTATRIVGGQVDNRAGGTSVNLRGLGASSTLILLNGRRMSPSGLTARFTNISSIPVTAIERVEVLTDGASAIYGSDAIGGVVNFILRDNYDGAETRLRYGADGRGDTSNILIGQSFGKSWDDGNILLTYEYYDSDNLANSAREIASTNDLSRFGGTDWRTPGGNPANIVAGGQTFAIPAGQDGTSLTAADFDPNAPLNLYNARSVGDVLPTLQRHSALLHLTQGIGAVELFAEAQFTSQEIQNLVNFGTFDITVTDTNPFFVDPTGTGLTTVRVDSYSLEDDITPAEILGELDSLGAALGVRFDIGESWNGELASNWAKEDAMRANTRRVDRDALDAAVNQADPNLAFNPFGDGSNTNPAVLESLLDRTLRIGSESENELWVLNLNVDGDAFDVPSGAVQVATGIEFRRESIKTDAIEEFTSDTSRDVLAAYAELFFPLLGNSNSQPGAQRLELSFAGRYEDYSDFGSSTNPKVGLLWSPTQTLELRGTYGASFRAPALFDLDVTINGSNSYLPQLFVDLGIIPFPLILRLGGNEDLQPETATTWTAGIEWSPEHLNGLSLDVTYFNIDFENRIGVPTPNLIEAANDPRFRTLLTLNPTAEQVAALVDDPIWSESIGGITTPAEDVRSGVLPVGAILDARTSNLSQSIVTGVDLQLSYNFETTLGFFDLGLSGSYLFDFQQRFIEADPLVDEVDTYGRPVDLKARGNVTWGLGDWAVTGFVNYTDGYTDNVNDDPARSIDSWTTVDLTIAYDTGDTNGFLSDARILLTTQNLFNEAPPFVNTLEGLAYDSTNGNPLGRFLTLQLTKEW